MTRSELCTVLTAGMATVASNVLALYVSVLKAQFPTIAGHLISASILSAPAALIFSKILVPETGEPETLGTNVEPYYEKESNVFESIINSAQAGLKLIFGIAALLIAVLGLLALVNLVLGWAGGGINSMFGMSFTWTLEHIMGYVFYPFAVILGVPLSEAFNVSQLIGTRLIATEVPAYFSLGALIQNGAISGRSAVIAAYSLCGFAHVASLSIFVGGITAIAPGAMKTLTRVGLKALLAATLACLATGCIAGMFFREGTILLGM